MANIAKNFVGEILNMAGIEINGPQPWDIKVHNEKFYSRALKGSIGLGESYMDGWWDVTALDEFFYRIIKANLEKEIGFNFKTAMFILNNTVFNRQNENRSSEVAEKHYNLGNDLYTAMLDPLLAYSSGYWLNASNLAQAQQAKLDLICRKINLQPGDDILDIGGGWGSFALYASKKYKVHVDVVTISKAQIELGRKLCKDLDVCFILRDYREIDGSYDNIVSVGMFEHVGYKNYRDYMEIAARHLKTNGLFLLHTIGRNKSVKSTDPWIEKYIFPNSMLPSITQIGQSIEGLFVMEDWHNFSADYDKTLIVWHANFEKNWPSLKDKYGERFYRMWRYYLLSCAGSFRARRNQLWQIVLSKNGVAGGYQTIR